MGVRKRNPIEFQWGLLSALAEFHHLSPIVPTTDYEIKLISIDDFNWSFIVRARVEYIIRITKCMLHYKK